MRFILWITLFLISSGLAACSSAIKHSTPKYFAPADEKDLARIQASDELIEVELYKERADCRVEKLKFSYQPLFAEPDTFVFGQLYTPAKNQSEKGVIVVPPTGGATFIDRGYASKLCARGLPVLLLDSWLYRNGEGSIDYEVHDRGQLRAMAVIRQAMHVQQRKNPQVKQWSLLGTSVGGIWAALSAARFSGITDLVLIASGAPLAEVIAESRQEALAHARAARMQQGRLNQEQYLEQLRTHIQIEPIQFWRSKSPGDLRVRAFLAEDDTVVATRFQEQLAQVWPQAKITRVSGDHRGAIVKTWWYHSEDIVDFLASNNALR